jgi:cyanophycin synthetase
MQIVSTAVYVGPNVYAKLPLIRLTVDLHRRADTPVSEYGDVLFAPLLEHLPGLAAALTEEGQPFLDRLKAPTAGWASSWLRWPSLCRTTRAPPPTSP